MWDFLLWHQKVRGFRTSYLGLSGECNMVTEKGFLGVFLSVNEKKNT